MSKQGEKDKDKVPEQVAADTDTGQETATVQQDDTGMQQYNEQTQLAEQEIRQGENDLLQSYTDYINTLAKRTGVTESEREKKRRYAKKAQLIAGAGQGLAALANLATTMGGGVPSQVTDAVGAISQRYRIDDAEMRNRLDKIAQLSDAAKQGRAQTLYNINVGRGQRRAATAKAAIDTQLERDKLAQERAMDLAKLGMDAEKLAIERRKADNQGRYYDLLAAIAQDKAKRDELQRRYGDPIEIVLPDGNKVVVGEQSYTKNIISRADAIYNAALDSIDAEIRELGGVDKKGRAHNEDNAERIYNLINMRNTIRMKYMDITSENDKMAFATEYYKYDPESVEMLTRLASEYYRASGGLPAQPDQEQDITAVSGAPVPESATIEQTMPVGPSDAEMEVANAVVNAEPQVRPGRISDIDTTFM